MINNIFRKSEKLRFIALLMTMAICLCACGDVTDEAPELLDPVSTNEAYRPVEIGDVGNNVIKMGSVVPTDYCYFYNTSATVSKMYVNVGDYVEEGDVLAEADVDETESSIEELESELETLQQTQNVNQKIYQETQKEYDYKIKACKEAGDTDGANEYETEKALEAENNRYDTMLYNYQVKKIQAEIEEKEDLQTNNTLVADHSGYVTYAKSLVTSDGDNSAVSGGENVVIISDYDEKYIEITGENVKKDGYSIYNMMYTIIDGERYDLEEYSYTNQELAAAQSASSLPYVRFNLKDTDNSALTTGATVPLYFSTSTAEQVLIVGNDSLYQDGDQYFVYVKTENSDKERRNIVIGATDDNYTEVTSGLSEGELVFYDSDLSVPGSYTTYDITLSDFSVSGFINSNNITLEDANQVTYSAPCGGYFETFDLVEGQEVTEGDLLFTIDSGSGSARLVQINSEINSAKGNYDDTIADYNAQIKELNNQISEYKSGKRVATPGDADSGVENTLYMVEQLTCEIQILTYQKQLAKIDYNSTVNPLIEERDKLNENNDGNGNISVYAESDGVIQSIFVSSGYELTEGDKIVSIGSGEKQMVLVTPSDDDYDGTVTLSVNQNLTFVSKSDDDESLSATVIGTNGDPDRSYVTTIDGEVYISSCSNSGTFKYYVEVDEEFYDAPSGYKIKYTRTSLENIVSIPKGLLYHETDKTSGKEYDYVWKLSDGEMIKQYVTIGEENTTSYCILSGLSDGDVIIKETSE